MTKLGVLAGTFAMGILTGFSMRETCTVVLVCLVVELMGVSKDA